MAAAWPRGVVARRPALDDLRPRLRRLRRSDAAFAFWAVLGGVIVARLVADERWQEALTIVAVVCAVAVYARWPTAGISVLLIIWVLAPFARRMLDYIALSFGPDLLSLAPFIATGAIALVAARRAPPSGAVLLVLGLFGAALAIGVPAGLTQPTAAAYGLFTYGAGALALLIGRRDGLRGDIALQRALVFVVPLVALYGIYQALAPLPPWDDLWLRVTRFVSVGTKEAGNFRAFGPLNAPATLATLLAVSLIVLLARRRFETWRLLLAVPAAVALALTSVRTAWLSLAAAAVVLIPLSRGRALPRVALVVAMLAALYIGFGGTSAGQRVAERATTLTNVEGDQSFRTRLTQVVELGPRAVAAPLGHGLGSVGQSARAGQGGFSELVGFSLVDNGYLIVVWQVGPLGLLLFLGAVGVALWVGMRGPPGTVAMRRLDLLAPVALLLIAMASGETVYGLTALLLWYHLGALMGRAEAEHRAPAAGEAARAQPAPPPVHTPPRNS
jgi:hypothetical protein